MAYYIGLDLGTSSVGWAVTDENYNLVKNMEKIYGEYVNSRRQKLLQKEEHRELAEEGDKGKLPE